MTIARFTRSLKISPMLILALSASTTLARPEIGPGDFSGSETRINFDSLSGGSSITTGDIIEFQYQALGIVFHNPDHLNRANANLSPLFPGHTPPNMMFVDQGGGGLPAAGPLSIPLTVPVNRIGMFVAGSFNVTYTLSVYGASGLLETLVKPGVAGANGTTCYLGLQRSEQIVRAEVSCQSLSTGVGPFNFSADDVQFEAVGASCYANCDNSTAPPVLNANDFQCFLNEFAAGSSSANCDGSTNTPILTANDFQCFLNKFAAGCS